MPAGHDLFEKLIESEYVAHLAPKDVYEWLRDNNAGAEDFFDELPEGLQQKLAQRDDPIINLGLARYGDDKNLLLEFLNSGNTALRCAVLANRHLRGTFGHRCILEEDTISDVMENGSNAERAAFLTNESLREDELAGYLEWSEPSDEKKEWNVYYALMNPNLRYDPGGSETVPDDGYAWYLRRKAVEAAWRLLDTVPATLEWVRILNRTLENIPYEGVPRPYEGQGETKDPNWFTRMQQAEKSFFEDAFKKWKGKDWDGSDDDTSEDSDRWYCELRGIIASKAPTHNKELMKLIRNHSDPVVRSQHPDKRALLEEEEEPSPLDRIEAMVAEMSKGARWILAIVVFLSVVVIAQWEPPTVEDFREWVSSLSEWEALAYLLLFVIVLAGIAALIKERISWYLYNRKRD